VLWGSVRSRRRRASGLCPCTETSKSTRMSQNIVRRSVVLGVRVSCQFPVCIVLRLAGALGPTSSAPVRFLLFYLAHDASSYRNDRAVETDSAGVLFQKMTACGAAPGHQRSSCYCRICAERRDAPPTRLRGRKLLDVARVKLPHPRAGWRVGRECMLRQRDHSPATHSISG